MVSISFKLKFSPFIVYTPVALWLSSNTILSIL